MIFIITQSIPEVFFDLMETYRKLEKLSKNLQSRFQNVKEDFAAIAEKMPPAFDLYQKQMKEFESLKKLGKTDLKKFAQKTSTLDRKIFNKFSDFLLDHRELDLYGHLQYFKMGWEYSELESEIFRKFQANLLLDKMPFSGKKSTEGAQHDFTTFLLSGTLSGSIKHNILICKASINA